MPYVEILAPPLEPSAKAAAMRAVTDGIVRGFAVGPGAVTIFLLPIEPEDYAHAGAGGRPGAPQRVLVKVHAYRRDAAKRRAVAAATARPLAAALGVEPEDVAIYFLEREPDEVAHGDKLASD